MDSNLKTGLGHVGLGTHVEIKDSPINVHIHIHTNDASLGQKIGRAIKSFIYREPHHTISSAKDLTEATIQGRISSAVRGEG